MTAARLRVDTASTPGLVARGGAVAARTIGILVDVEPAAQNYLATLQSRVAMLQSELAAIGENFAVMELFPDGTIVDCDAQFTAAMGNEAAEVRGKHAGTCDR